MGLAILLLAALALRLGWALRQPSDDASLAALPDQREYITLARNLLAGQGLQFRDPDFGDVVYAFRTPGYPAFLALCGGSIRAARLAQVLIDTSTVLAVYLLARRWLAERQSLLAAAIVAFNPFLIYLCSLLLTETVFTAMLAWGMVLLVRVRSYLWGGAVLALAILVRPSGLLLPILLGIASVFVNRNTGSAYQRRPKWLPRLKWPLPVASTMLLLSLVVLMPWACRNYSVLGRWVWTTTNGGITNYDGLNPNATGASDQRAIRSLPMLRSMGEVQRDEYLSDLAAQFVREHPRRVLELAAVKVARLWSPIPLSEQYGSRMLYVVVGLLYSLPLDVLTLLGLWASAKPPQPDAVSHRAPALPVAAKAFLLLPAVYFTLVHSLSVGSLRYRIPVEPPMAIVAAVGLAAVVAALPRRQRQTETQAPTDR